MIASEALRVGFDVQALNARHHDIRNPNTLIGLDAIINAAPQTSNALHRSALEAGCHMVDVGISEDVIRSALALDAFAQEQNLTLVLMAGLAPGLSGMLGYELAKRTPSARKVDVVLLQNAQGTAGKRGVSDMLDMLSDKTRSPITQLNDDVLPGSERRNRYAFALPTPETALLSQDIHEPSISYHTLFNSHAMNRTIRLLGIIRRVSESAYSGIRNLVATRKSRQPPPDDETIYLSAVATDAEGTILAREDLKFASDYGATSKIAVALTDMALAGRFQAGAGHPSKFSDWRTVTAQASFQFEK